MIGFRLSALPCGDVRFLRDRQRDDGGYTAATRGDVRDAPSDGRVVQDVRELCPQVSNAYLFGHGGMVPERALMYTCVHVEGCSMASKGTITPDGYRLVRRPNHPLANRWGSVPEHREVLFDAIGDGEHPCHWCGRTLTWRGRVGAQINADHLDEDRLNNARENLVPACLDCNTRRGTNGRGLRELAKDLAALDDPLVVKALRALADHMESSQFRRASLLAFEIRGLAIDIQALNERAIAGMEP